MRPGETALRVRPARPDDDAAIRRLLRERALDGAIRLSLTREPSFFASLDRESLRHDTLLVEEADTGALVGMGTRQVQPARLEGEEVPLGYLSQVRLAPGRRLPRRAMIEAWRLFTESRQAGEAPFDLTSITRDNLAARRLLERGLPGQPPYRPLADYAVRTLPTTRRPPSSTGIEIREASEAQWAELQALRRRRLDAAALALPGPTAPLALRLVALRRGRLLAGLGLLDASPWRQFVVQGYRGPLRWSRPLANLAAPWIGTPRLPRAGRVLASGSVVSLAHQPGEEPAAVALLRHAAFHASRLGLDLLLVGGLARDGLAPWLDRALPARRYHTRLYAVAWSPAADFWAEALREAARHDGLQVELSAL